MIRKEKSKVVFEIICLIDSLSAVYAKYASEKSQVVRMRISSSSVYLLHVTTEINFNRVMWFFTMISVRIRSILKTWFSSLISKYFMTLMLSILLKVFKTINAGPLMSILKMILQLI